MNKNIIIDLKCGNKVKQKAKQLLRTIDVRKIDLKDTYIIISNDSKYVLNVIKNNPSKAKYINITQNISQRYLAEIIDYMKDICYIESDLDVIIKRIIRDLEK